MYGGFVLLGAEAFDVVDGQGQTVPGLADAHLTRYVAAPLLYYVPDVSLLGGSIGIGGFVPAGHQCGHLLFGEQNDCTTGIGDAYVEFDWSRTFGHVRPSRYPGAFPILEGLTILAGVGVVLPTGKYDVSSPTQQALSTGNNTWDIAPTLGFTYTTPPIIAEGTEFSARFYWNNYLENSRTGYTTGDILDLEYAISERIGRFQLGVAGYFAWQIKDDEQYGVPVPPDGRRAKFAQIGPVLNYDMPEHGSTLKVKGLTSILAENTVRSWGVALTWLKKF